VPEGRVKALDLSAIFRATAADQRPNHAVVRGGDRVDTMAIVLARAAKVHGFLSPPRASSPRPTTLSAIKGLLPVSAASTPTHRRRIPHVEMPKPNQFSYASNDGGQERHYQVTVPLGLPRFVTVRTLKEMMSGRNADSIVYRAVGNGWEILSNDHVVDLANANEIFRIGTVYVAS
jgi:hypothetical protein